MFKKMFPEKFYEIISKIPFEALNEIRIRVNAPVVVNIKGANHFICNSGLTTNKDDAIIGKNSLIDYILQQVSDNSLYTINDQIINGYITYEGIRIGVSGELVVVNGKIKTVKNINALNIRVPHIIKNCSLPIYNFLAKDGIKNTLVISPPGAGKTTFLRDFVYQLSTKENKLNILIADERSEITGVLDENYLNGIDVYKNCTKEFAFNNGIRSMKPDVIITDEIDINNDIHAIENAITSGVKVVASVHANNLQDLKNKKAFNEILNKQLFDRFVIISTANGYGTIEGVYNENLRCIYA